MAQPQGGFRGVHPRGPGTPYEGRGRHSRQVTVAMSAEMARELEPKALALSSFSGPSSASPQTHKPSRLPHSRERQEVEAPFSSLFACLAFLLFFFLNRRYWKYMIEKRNRCGGTGVAPSWKCSGLCRAVSTRAPGDGAMSTLCARARTHTHSTQELRGSRLSKKYGGHAKNCGGSFLPLSTFLLCYGTVFSSSRTPTVIR